MRVRVRMNAMTASEGTAVVDAPQLFLDRPDQAVSVTRPKKRRAGLAGHIDVVGERSLSGDQPGVFTAPHRLGNSESVCHGAW